MKLVAIACLFISFLSFAGDHSKIKAQIETIFSAADSRNIEGLNRYMEFVSNDVILMPHNANTVTGKNAYKAHVQAVWNTGKTEIKHQLIDFTAFDEVVIARGKATGTFQPRDSSDTYNFQTKKLFIFKRIGTDKLQVWQVIFNMDPQ